METQTIKQNETIDWFVIYIDYCLTKAFPGLFQPWPALKYQILEKLASKYREAFYDSIKGKEQKLCPIEKYYKKKVSK